jgi:hypothetical protein
MIPCPGCQRALRAQPQYFGEHVVCMFCDHPFRVSKFMKLCCPGCHRDLRIGATYMGRHVRCQHCDHGFEVHGPMTKATVPVSLPGQSQQPVAQTAPRKSQAPPRAAPAPADDDEELPRARDLGVNWDALRADYEGLADERKRLAGLVEEKNLQIARLEQAFAAAAQEREAAGQLIEKKMADARSAWQTERRGLELRWQDEHQAAIEDFEQQLREAAAEHQELRRQAKEARQQSDDEQRSLRIQVRAVALELEEARRLKSIVVEEVEQLQKKVEQAVAGAAIDRESWRQERHDYERRLEESHQRAVQLHQTHTLEKESLITQRTTAEQRLSEAGRARADWEASATADRNAREALASQVALLEVQLRQKEQEQEEAATLRQAQERTENERRQHISILEERALSLERSAAQAQNDLASANKERGQWALLLEQERAASAEQARQLQVCALDETEKRVAALDQLQAANEQLRREADQRHAEQRAQRELWKQEHEAQVQALEQQARERLALLVENGRLRDELKGAIHDRDRALERAQGLPDGRHGRLEAAGQR